MSETTPEDLVATVAAQARAKDPGLPPETAALLARDAVAHLATGAADAPDLARRLLAEHPEAGATAASVVARAAAESVGKA